MTPFQALYGRLPPTIPHYHIGMSLVNEVDQQLVTRDEILSLLKANLHAANNRMQQLANSKRRDIEFQEGDWVFLKLHSYRQQSVFKWTCKKLASCFYSPYQIEQRIGKVSYKLKLPKESCILPVFHVSLFKKKLGDCPLTTVELPPIADNGDILIEPEVILDTRWIKKGHDLLKKVLSNGNNFQMTMLLGKMLVNCERDLPTWTFRTRFL